MIKTTITYARLGLNRFLLLAFTLLVAAGCKKNNSEQNPLPADYGSRINFILQDNFNFSTTSSALAYTGLIDSLGKDGPYTFIATTDNNFRGLLPADNGGTNFSFWQTVALKNILQYQLLPGAVSFKKLPVKDNQAILNSLGSKVYISKYLNGSDTIVTVNCIKLLSLDNLATNGFIQVIPGLCNQEIYSSLPICARSTYILSFFAAALQRSGLDVSLLDGKDSYTLLAPSNDAFKATAALGKNMGISTLDSILTANPTKLRQILQYHIIRGRLFQNDLLRLNTANPDGITMLDGKKVLVSPYGNNDNAFTGIGNDGNMATTAKEAGFKPAISYANIPCGNGVIHAIDRVLIP